MKLEAIDWKTITKRQAIALLNAANRQLTAVGERYNAGTADDEDFSVALYRVEDLEMFVECSLPPTDPRSLHLCYRGCVHGALESEFTKRARDIRAERAAAAAMNVLAEVA